MEDNNTKNISDTNLIKLQESISKCLDLWFDFNWIFPNAVRINLLHCSEYIELDIHYSDWVIARWVRMSYHDLFSKDSWLMEFVRWKQPLEWFTSQLGYFYCRMSMMTAEEKIQYFLDNAIVPEKKLTQ